MAHVIFYGKADCPANAKQRRQLEAAGHTLDVRDLASEAWTPESLMAFFQGRPVGTWLNKLHPKVRTNAIDPDAQTPDKAIALMLADPDLIRRPLLQVGEQKRFGYDPVAIEAWIGLRPKADGMTCDEKHAVGRCDHGHQHVPQAASA
ncbi:MAG: nitrogen fixation protein NifO [Caenispirillum bisanense]|nr:nitrogen fixation protein NifO [Caenispirillum bisanense]MCA1973930.1 nitrogen fixation protein NifO [Caenispirillum sp.]